jgi:hypothetical protein
MPSNSALLTVRKGLTYATGTPAVKRGLNANLNVFFELRRGPRNYARTRPEADIRYTSGTVREQYVLAPSAIAQHTVRRRALIKTSCANRRIL